jgi:Tol biopolymer transport system component
MKRILILCAVLATTALITAPAWASFPGQGNRVLIARSVKSGSLDLYTMKQNGKSQQRLARTGGVLEYGGHLSPDGSRIVYMGSSAAGTQIYAANADGSQRKRLTSTKSNYSPNWSRNGGKIVFVRTATALRPAPDAPAPFRGVTSAALTVMNANGTGRHTVLDGSVYGPGWSPTSNRIAYSRTWGPGAIDVFTIKADGTDERQVTDGGATVLFADWSPDGRRLAIMVPAFAPRAPRGGIATATLFTIKPNGNGATPVVNNVVILSPPQYTADGTRLLFVRDKPSSLEIYSIRTNGTGLKRLTNNTHADLLTFLPG